MRTRNFGLMDLMILVAATASGLALGRYTLYQKVWTGYGLFYGVHNLLAKVLPYIASLTPAVLLIQLRQRPLRLSRLTRQPGAVACASATLALLIVGAYIATQWAFGLSVIRVTRALDDNLEHFMGGSQSIQGPWPGMLVGYIDRIGFAVAGSWFVGILGGRWRPEATWMDRSGRALGLCWIGMTVLMWVSDLWK